MVAAAWTKSSRKRVTWSLMPPETLILNKTYRIGSKADSPPNKSHFFGKKTGKPLLGTLRAVATRVLSGRLLLRRLLADSADYPRIEGSSFGKRLHWQPGFRDGAL